MGRRKRSVRQQRAFASAAPADEPAVHAEPPPSPSPLSQLAATVASVSLSASHDEVKHDSADEEAATNSDSDAPARKRPRKKSGHYNKPLTPLERLEILRLHISEGKTAVAISKVFGDRGLTVPVSTIYTLFNKQAKGKPIDPQPRHRRTKYTEEDAKLVVQAQQDHNDWHYDDLRRTWKEANPDKSYVPSNHTLHKWLADADITKKQLYAVPVARNQPANIAARKEYSLRAMTWARDTLIFIDETTFSRGLHSTQGRSKRGTPAYYVSRNGAGIGLKVCAAVSPTLGLVMYETQLTAYTGTDFARFMQRLCDHPLVKRQSMILVVDNVAVHFTQPVQDTMAGQSIQHTIERLPTYSPHLNPIEYCFHNWKNEIKHVDQLHDRRTLQQQVDECRTVITDHLVTRILEHVYQLYAHCILEKPLEEFKPIGHRVARAQEEAALQRAVIAAAAEEEKE